MTDSNQKYALLSVTDKDRIVSFAKGLIEQGFTILSTGGTAKKLIENDIAVIEVSELTGSQEMLSGRVKTLHPMIHGGILWDRSNAEHKSQTKEFNIPSIDVVAVNLYAFHKKAIAENLGLAEAIEHIDIGGPTMLRSAAKNWQHCSVLVDPEDYDSFLQKNAKQGLDENDRLQLALKVFSYTAYYDASISKYFQSANSALTKPLFDAIPTEQVSELRYGENPHQCARFLSDPLGQDSYKDAEIIQGKQLSYNNLLDLNAAANLARDLGPERACVIVKHTNPCGSALASKGEELSSIYKRALSGDPKSAFGGIIAFNTAVDEETAQLISEIFVECIVAPNFSPEALAVFSAKKNLRILRHLAMHKPLSKTMEYRSIDGGMLAQERDTTTLSRDTDSWNLTTDKKAEADLIADLAFATQVCGHVKSNAIVLAKCQQTLTIGAGQMSRIDALEFAIQKAEAEGKDLRGAVLASDAFFPFSDCVEIAAKAGIAAISQPGGSIRDQDSIDACNKGGISMYFTGRRHFKH